jgi:hypothetical protein
MHPFSSLATAGTEMRFRCALPNQFRCQTSKPFRFIEKARPEAVETCRNSLERLASLSPDRRHHFGNPKQMAAIRKHRMSLVELSGIEPLTSCLQSTRSPN